MLGYIYLADKLSRDKNVVFFFFCLPLNRWTGSFKHLCAPHWHLYEVNDLRASGFKTVQVGSTKTRIRFERIIPTEALFTIYLNWCTVNRVARKIGKMQLKVSFMDGGRRSSHSHGWKIVCFSSPCLVVTSFGFKIHYRPDKSVTNPWRVFHLQKKLKRGTLFFLPTVEGLSW